MKSHCLVAAILCLLLVGCNKKHSARLTEPDDSELTTCKKHQLNQQGCGKYKVLSYDATWKNDSGNEGEYMLERDGLRIRAFCGQKNCSFYTDSVGQNVVADKSITDLITHYQTSCEDPLYVKNAREFYKRTFGREGTVSDVCWDTLVVEKVEALTH